MKIRSLLAAAAALTLTSAPVLAQSAAADLGRALSPVAGEELEGDQTVLVVGAVVLLGIGIALLVDDDKSVSP